LPGRVFQQDQREVYVAFRNTIGTNLTMLRVSK
jgi:hypothetical protein